LKAFDGSPEGRFVEKLILIVTTLQIKVIGFRVLGVTFGETFLLVDS